MVFHPDAAQQRGGNKIAFFQRGCLNYIIEFFQGGKKSAHTPKPPIFFGPKRSQFRGGKKNFRNLGKRGQVFFYFFTGGFPLFRQFLNLILTFLSGQTVVFSRKTFWVLIANQGFLSDKILKREKKDRQFWEKKAFLG